jgi:YggT family protein
VISGNFVRALANLIHTIINVYIVIIIIRSIISWMGTIPPNPFIIMLRRLTDPVFRFVHRNLPFMVLGGIDVSPIAIVLVLYFIDNFITGFLLDLAVTLR